MKNKPAFTLVELIVVITILAILGTIGFISFQGYSQDARNTARISDITSLSRSVNLKLSEGLSLRSFTSGGQELTDASLGGTDANVGTNYSAGNIDPTALGIPEGDFLDPLSSGNYKLGVYTGIGGQYFQVGGTLESSGQQAIVKGNYTSRIASGIIGEGETGSQSFTFSNNTDLGKLRVGDVVSSSNSSLPEDTSIERIEGNTVFLSSSFTSPETSISLGETESLGLIASVPVNGIGANNPVVNKGFHIPLDLGTEDKIYGPEFVSLWRITTDNETVNLPLKGGYSYNFTVDWGDGTPIQTVTSTSDPDRSHTYASAGDYVITIEGTLPGFGNSNTLDPYKDQIISVMNLGDMGWRDLSFAFYDADNLVSVYGGETGEVVSMHGTFRATPNFENGDIGRWDTGNVTTMYGTFYDSVYNQDITSWDTGNVTTTDFMFYLHKTFNQNINSWDVSNVITMSQMFRGAVKFNQNLNSWDVRKVTGIGDMFRGATDFNGDISSWQTDSLTYMGNTFALSSFNQDIGDWDVSNVIVLGGAFSQTPFNQDIGDWDVSNVTNMASVFNRARDFNQDISSWDTSNVTNMSLLFYGANSFNQDIGSWNVGNVTTFSQMFRDSNFNQDISLWNTSKVTSIALMFANSPFNQDIGNWDTNNVTSMQSTFYGTPFNQDIGDWGTSNVVTMNSMFRGATNFNQDIGGWDVSNVTNMGYMFHSSSFNGNISSWRTDSLEYAGLMFANSNFNSDISADISSGSWNMSNVTNMFGMFQNNTVFNQDISGWDTSSVINMRLIMAGGSGFNQDLSSWNTGSVTDSTNFDFGASSWQESFKPNFN